MPTKKQFQTVIDNLKKVLPDAKSKSDFDMRQGSVFDYAGHICDTVHCIGGWYLISKADRFKNVAGLNFIDGANLMAEDLGFEWHESLEEWAGKNHEIWGNYFGYEMFATKRAYNNAETLLEAIVHLESVMNRLPK